MSAIPAIGMAAVTPLAQAGAATRSSAATAPASAASSSALWDVLTDEERSYFASMSALGPVSYGASGDAGSPASAPLGQRLDVRG
jgi:hypothetical protein